jgi:AcrR family transcriptional regulator
MARLRWGEDAPSDVSAARARLLDAAETCIDRFGLAKTTVEDIAGEANVSRATIYRYFANRDDLVLGVLLRDLDRAIEHPLDTFLDGATTPAQLGEAIVASAAYLLALIRSTPRLQLLLRTEGRGVSDAIAGASVALFRENGEDLRPYLEQARERGLLRPGLDLDEAAEWILRCILSLLTVEGPVVRDEAAERRLLATFLVPALVAPGA